ncbi:hypothetical protein SDC9_193430 [bioreactor metagenome]|uniref:Uncharacterized protein n=1 Tax=bioreactor metagenome TaxID=1076179 RepID=A0A645I3I6_9ZZZZ
MIMPSPIANSIVLVSLDNTCVSVKVFSVALCTISAPNPEAIRHKISSNQSVPLAACAKRLLKFSNLSPLNFF